MHYQCMFGISLGRYVRDSRRRRGMTREQLAAAAQYSVRWVASIESDQADNPSEKVLLALTEALSLTAWECQYMYLLARRVPPKMPVSSSLNLDRFVDYPSPHLVAHVGRDWSIKHANPEFRRLFKGLWLAPNLLQWHYVSVRALDIVLDWESSSDWLVSWIRFSLAASPDDPGLTDMVSRLLRIDLFRDQWERVSVPVDPATRTWRMRDLDHGVDLEVDMWTWLPAGVPDSDLVIIGVPIPHA
ncbi:transcriptional regulatory protein [Mycobacteroides abscessus subsp. bolletii]|nr:helix-turn-helix DNA binding protein [Mycobacterium phage prophiGD03-1]SIB03551.1 transcriptional regulatory protein [Mycobacteroides abscessus subsp. bolletii]SKT04928.1 transcriptional regulatory protein [Mycobacteroides abscessus subsp. bolletii]